MELIEDAELERAIREEILSARINNGIDAGKFDLQKLTSLPLLQSVYAETLRIHVSILITRTTTEPVVIGGYSIPKGSVFQAPTEVAHLDDTICESLCVDLKNTQYSRVVISY